MATITLQIPDDRYAAFLRLAADYLDGIELAPAERDRIELDGDDELARWRIGAMDQADDEFRLLVDYLRKLKGISAAVLDYLAEKPGPVDGETLANWVGAESRRAVAGSLGHAARFASQLGRVFPIKWDRDTGAYWLDDDLRDGDAVRQARIWTVPAPYDYFLELDGQPLRYRSDDIPARYALFHADMLDDPKNALIGFFHDQDAVVDYHSDAMRADAADSGFLRIEFTPDAVHRRHLVPLEDDDDFGARQERSHELVTLPQTDGFTIVEVRTTTADGPESGAQR